MSLSAPIPPIPVFQLFGETSAFPDVVHLERILDRAQHHDWSIAPHRHEEMAQLFLMERGSAKARIEGEIHRFEDGNFLFIPPKQVHSFEFSCGSEGWVLSFPLPIYQSLGPTNDELSLRLGEVLLAPVSQNLADQVHKLAGHYESSGIFRAQTLTAQAHLVLLEALGAGGTTRKMADQKRRQIQRFDALIAAHLGDGWSPSDYASELSITTGHLSRICRDAAGCGASAYLRRALMAEACRLLAFTQISVSEIGYRLGFHDPAYFSRSFRHLRGESPSDYRARFAE
ncbi:MAG: helix-turn-helix domain-containing protein [Mangrovicoccus sp.]